MSRLASITAGRTDEVFAWVAEGGSATACDARGVSLLQWCAYHGDVSAVRFLIGQGAQLTSLGDNLDLNGAVFHGHWQLSEFLIEAGADVNHALPDTGEVPLHSALCKPDRAGTEPLLRMLLAHGADPKRRTRPGVETGSFMRDIRTRGETPLHRAAAFASETAITMLLTAGAEREARDANGDSPLTWASWHLRPAYILDLLCFPPHRIHPEAVARSRR